jgi:hypothetical protein
MTITAIAGETISTGSGVAAAAGGACYVRGWLRGSVPSRISWTWWSLAYLAIPAALVLHGAPWPLLIMPGVSAVTCLVILALSLRRGTGEWDATARVLTAAVYPHATAAVALSVAVELAGAVPTAADAWRDRGAEPLDSWLLVAVSGVLSAAAVAVVHGPAVAWLLPLAWVLSGVIIPAVALLGEWARRVPGRREAIGVALAASGAVVVLGVMGVAAWQIETGLTLPGEPAAIASVFRRGALPRRPAVISPERRRGYRRPAGRTGSRRPPLAVPPPSSRPASRRPSPSRSGSPSPSPSPAAAPSPAVTPAPSPTGTPRPSPTYPTPTATASPSPTAAYPRKGA